MESRNPPDPGLCADCRHAERVVSGRGSVFTLCGRSRTESCFAKYPPLPVFSCRGYEKGTAPVDSADDDPTETLGKLRHYRLDRKLGEGGMGVVFAAFDERLERPVAIKMIRDDVGDRESRRRLLREARVAAGISHPNVCHVYDVDETGGRLYVAMELLEGEQLDCRIARGALHLDEALETSLGVLSALEVLHDRGIVHRDLKPSNVFITPYGVKLLDFGLARPLADPAAMQVTQPGTVLGTPRYMAPEQWTGGVLGPTCDLFAAGAILFEMITGKPAFTGTTLLEVCRAITHDQPPALSGGREAMAVDRIIQRALSKRPAERYPDAKTMARDVREARLAADSQSAGRVHTTTRLMVLPFRLLRPDPEIEFLAWSLPDAITVSLSGVESMVVRSSVAAARYASESPDLRAIAAEAAVDAVLVGTLLRAGDQIRVNTQLVDAPGGAVLGSRTVTASFQDIFGLQDRIVQEVLETLSITLSTQDQAALHVDAPKDPRAYELYLRGNQAGRDRRFLGEARGIYLQCLDLDPGFAPAWARLGRVYRVLAKYALEGDPEANYLEAQRAFAKALELNPDLSLAHNLMTHLDVEEGRSKDCMVRLIERAHRRPADPELFAGLVLACRFCGLLDASLAADRRARRLDPGIPTSVPYTYWVLGDHESVLVHDTEDVRWATGYSLPMIGRVAEAIERLSKLERGLDGVSRAMVQVSRAALEGDRAACASACRAILESRFHDPEGLYHVARSVAKVEEKELSLEILEEVITGGFTCPEAMARDPWFEPLHTESGFLRLLHQAEEKHREAAAAYRKAGGEQLLGVR